MDILIHTYGRPDRARQHTLKALAAAALPVRLVVQQREAHEYAGWNVPLVILPPGIERLSPTRDWIIHDMETPHDKVVFFDDDLHFFARRDDDRTKFRQPTPQDIRAMVTAIGHHLGSYAQVGIAPREGGNRLTDEYYENTRLMRVLAFRRDCVRPLKARFNDVHVMEDFHMNLSLLEAGHENLMLNNWCSNQAEGSNAPGGCSHYRTDAVQTAAAHALATLHPPGIVKVVQKATKTAWGGGERTDVVIQWKKAAALGQQKLQEAA